MDSSALPSILCLQYESWLSPHTYLLKLPIVQMQQSKVFCRPRQREQPQAKPCIALQALDAASIAICCKALECTAGVIGKRWCSVDGLRLDKVHLAARRSPKAGKSASGRLCSALVTSSIPAAFSIRTQSSLPTGNDTGIC